MACIAPPEPEDVALLAALDGEGETGVRQHLENCPHCMRRADELAQLNGSLGASLYRLDCPSANELSEFHMGLLPREQARVIASHLTGCQHCSEELAQLESFLSRTEADLDRSSPSLVQTIIAKLITGGDQGPTMETPALAQAYAGLRGKEDRPFIYEAEGIRIALDIAPDPEHPGMKIILGVVTGGKVDNLSAELVEKGDVIAAEDVDPSGNIVLTNIAPGVYDLTFIGQDRQVEIQNIEI